MVGLGSCYLGLHASLHVLSVRISGWTESRVYGPQSRIFPHTRAIIPLHLISSQFIQSPLDRSEGTQASFAIAAHRMTFQTLHDCLSVRHGAWISAISTATSIDIGPDIRP
jgi:hypothetical protein